MSARFLASVTLAATVGLSTAALAEAPAPIQWPCLNPPTMSSAIPGDTVLSDQPSFNCFAWQEFIALNWPAGKSGAPGPASAFGTPGDRSPVVFETYKNVLAFLKPDGSAPGGWNDSLVSAAAIDPAHPYARPMEDRISKFRVHFNGQDIAQAGIPDPAEAWLADKDGNLVWYEVLVNRPEFEYFRTTGYYNSETQSRAMITDRTKKPDPELKIDLPKGSLAGGPGAIELKAAWVTVPLPFGTDWSKTRWSRYKLATGMFCDSFFQGRPTCTYKTLALVGLHILHKTTSQPSWVWASFEHVDNAPSQAEVDAGTVAGDYTFFSRNCRPLSVPAECGAKQKQTSCVPNTPPIYPVTVSGGNVTSKCPPYPIQVTRAFATPDTNENPVVRTNKAAQALIRSANPDSVYQYYKLVNVLWNDSPVDENRGFKPPVAPLSDTAFRPNPNAFPMANTTLETYFQNLTCISCHSHAKIAKSPLNADPIHASDYSFVFQMAGPQPK